MKLNKLVNFKLGSHFENYEKYLEIYQKPGKILEFCYFGKLGTLHCSMCEVLCCTFVNGVATAFVQCEGN